MARSWWEALDLCWGYTKEEILCQRPKRKAYEIKPGQLFIPMTCNLHIDQEKKLREDNNEQSS